MHSIIPKNTVCGDEVIDNKSLNVLRSNFGINPE